jgi:hypothetical protein
VDDLQRRGRRLFWGLVVAAVVLGGGGSALLIHAFWSQQPGPPVEHSIIVRVNGGDPSARTSTSTPSKRFKLLNVGFEAGDPIVLEGVESSSAIRYYRFDEAKTELATVAKMTDDAGRQVVLMALGPGASDELEIIVRERRPAP